MNIYSVLLDILILIVLSITITFCLRLNKRLLEVQSNKKEIASFINALDNSILTAHQSITTLKELTHKVSDEREKYMEEGARLADDLSFMIQSGNRLLQRSNNESGKLIESTAVVRELVDELNKQMQALEAKSELLNNQHKKNLPEKTIIQTI